MMRPFSGKCFATISETDDVKLSFSSTSQNPLKQELNSEIMKEVLP